MRIFSHYSLKQLCKMINIAHIITKLELGGAQYSTLYTTENLNKNRYSVFLISSLGILGEEALRLPAVKTILTPLLKREISPLFDIFCIFYLFFQLKRYRIDIIHTHSSKAGILGRWAGRLAGVPVILHTVHGFPFHRFQNVLVRSLYIFLERVTAYITDYLITICVSDLEKGLKNKIGEKRKYILLRDGIEIEKLTLSKREIIQIRKTELAISEKNLIVGMIACFKPQKSPLDFVRVASLVHTKVPSCLFLLIGDGVLRKEIERFINRSNLTEVVKLLGWEKDAWKLIPLFDICLLTSYWEGLPKFLLEAMACEKPIVATDVDGIPEVVKNGVNGFLLPPGNCEGIAEKVIFLLTDEKMREKMGKASRELLTEEFHIKNMVAQLDILYQRCYNQKAKDYKRNLER